ncbi:MAG: ATP-dependent helicase [Eggerthellaceae bacterium]|nr:ATP-dependent helicase [Eggerthellaceae bacterium]
MSDLAESMAWLNDAQRKAVEHVEGPLLVVAGPGTGKTQLLSLRAANILATCDVQPCNILCLTYTEAGAEAMRKRLIELVGRDAYGIEVSTFHSFASSVRSRYPEYFKSNPNATPVSSLHAKEIIDGLLKDLPYDNPLAGTRQGVATNLSLEASFIAAIKRSGLLVDEFTAMMQQNIAFADYLESQTDVLRYFENPLPRKVAEKEAYVAAFEELLTAALALAPSDLLEAVVTTPGMYEPYAKWLAEKLQSTELIDKGGKTAGFQELRKLIAYKDDDGAYRAAIRKVSQKGLAAIEVYEGYQRKLTQEGLIDFDDMVMDCILAIREYPELRYRLQERYRFIQVDEFQDTNGAQMRIVELLCEGIEHPNVMAVGDDDQAIMRFQGASIACINQFQDLYHPKNVVLKINYRSTPDIVKLGRGVAEQVENRLAASATDKVISAFRDSCDQVEFAETVFASQELEYRALARDIRARIDAGFIEQCKNPEEAIAVIANKHALLKSFIPFLREQNIPFAYKATTELFAMESMQTLLALMRYVAAYSLGRQALAESYLPQIIAARELGGENIPAVSFALFAERGYRKSWTRAMAETSDARINKLHATLMEWCALAPATSARDILFRIAQPCMSYYERMSKSEPLAFAEFNGGVRALLGFVEAEWGTPRTKGRAMRLADVIERLDRATLFGETIDASIELDAPGAVRLTSAHSSKGLEFDLVYMLDAEDHVWHSGGSSAGLFAPNVFVGNERDDDDVRRLLFVTVTRAKSYLELYRAGGNTLRELSESVSTIEVPASVDDMAYALATSWEDSYALDTPELQALLAPNLPPKSLSVSALNAFVDYHEDSPNYCAFPNKYVLRLPAKPEIFFEFGTQVHEYFENYVNHVIKAQDVSIEELNEQYRASIANLDFAEEDVATYLRRFDRITTHFDAWARPRLTGRLATEVKLNALAGDNVPLFGVCDLLIIDDAAHTIRVVDYKTGFGYPTGKPDRSYERQLQFYRLLIENSPEFFGYRVISCEDWYVEPERSTDQPRMHEPIVASVNDEDIVYLTTLLNAAWHCIAQGDFNISQFTNSDQKAFAESELSAMKRPSKKDREEALQLAYEAWLIARDESRAS